MKIKEIMDELAAIQNTYGELDINKIEFKSKYGDNLVLLDIMELSTTNQKYFCITNCIILQQQSGTP